MQPQDICNVALTGKIKEAEVKPDHGGRRNSCALLACDRVALDGYRESDEGKKE